jgi:PTH1 family peptidyl-tRNA hydrolase
MPFETAERVLVVGLGNPGLEYAHTRHNAGFMAVEALAARLGVSYWKDACGARVGAGRLMRENGLVEVVLAMPQSYMNTSGGPVSKLCRAYETDTTTTLIIHDELDIPAGDVRLKLGGGAGGHNGLKSIIASLGTNDFCRVRMGIGRPPGRQDPADYVLRELKGEALEDMRVTAQDAADAVELILAEGFVRARDAVNAR